MLLSTSLFSAFNGIFHGQSSLCISLFIVYFNPVGIVSHHLEREVYRLMFGWMCQKWRGGESWSKDRQGTTGVLPRTWLTRRSMCCYSNAPCLNYETEMRFRLALWQICPHIHTGTPQGSHAHQYYTVRFSMTNRLAVRHVGPVLPLHFKCWWSLKLSSHDRITQTVLA